jgi:hypothetical protein
MRYMWFLNLSALFGVCSSSLPTHSVPDNITTSTTPSPRLSEHDPSPVDLSRLFRMLLSGQGHVFSSEGTSRRANVDHPQWVIQYYNRISEIASTPEQVITIPSINDQIRIIGRQIYAEHGHEGMVQVCEYNRQYRAFIERAWDGIGRWLA